MGHSNYFDDQDIWKDLIKNPIITHTDSIKRTRSSLIFYNLLGRDYQSSLQQLEQFLQPPAVVFAEDSSLWICATQDGKMPSCFNSLTNCSWGIVGTLRRWAITAIPQILHQTLILSNRKNHRSFLTWVICDKLDWIHHKSMLSKVVCVSRVESLSLFRV